MELWFTEHHSEGVDFSIRVDKQLYTEQSEFQRIDVFESKEFGRFLTLDGLMMLTEKDEFIYHEMIVHPAMAVHPHVRRVLLIGAGRRGRGAGALPLPGNRADRHGGDRRAGGGGEPPFSAKDRLLPGRRAAPHLL